MNNAIKNILLGVTGGIAAYKSAELIRLFKKNGLDVKVVMTTSAQAFITPLTLATLSQHQVYTDLFEHDAAIGHIELARWADAIIIAPTSANLINKLSHGAADDLLSTLCLAITSPIYLAPAMNQAMWHNALVQKNIHTLNEYGYHILAPDSGEQACGETGIGRMPAPEAIVDAILSQSTALCGRTIMVTAGPTIEAIDPVRFISNHSSGKMGYAIAEAAARQGANVMLISGPSQLQASNKLHRTVVATAEEMYQQVMQHIHTCDVFIATAAVADYRPLKAAATKIKRQNNHQATLELIANPDILATVAALDNPPFTIGFAAETDNLLENAQKKLSDKKIDMIAANLVGRDQGFYQANNSLHVITKDGQTILLNDKSKKALAEELMTLLRDLLANNA